MAIYSLFFTVIVGKPHFHAFSHNTSKLEVFISLVPAVLKILPVPHSYKVNSGCCLSQ